MVEILAPANLHEGYLLDAVYNGISFPVIVVSDSRYIHVAHSLTAPSHLPKAMSIFLTPNMIRFIHSRQEDV
jgi:hypothetical protein